MKLNAALVLFVAFAAGAGTFAWRATHTGAVQEAREPELRWLQREFALSDAALRRVGDLHRRYIAECEPMCAAQRASDAELKRLIRTNRGVGPDMERALKHSNEIVLECQRRMLQHFYEVARQMPDGAGERYLALMTPIVMHPEDGRWMKATP